MLYRINFKKIVFMWVTVMIVSISWSSTAGWAHLAEQSRVIALVKKTAAALKKHPKQTLIEISNLESMQFKDESLYIYVYDMEGTVLAHGANAAVMVGKNLIEKRDPDGKFFIQELRDIARQQISGWVNFKFPNPAMNGAIQNKTGYVMKIDLSPSDARELGLKEVSIFAGSGYYQ